MLTNRIAVSLLGALGLLLGSCASTAPADPEKVVRVYDVYRDGREALPREVEGCEYLGGVSASAPAPEASGVAFSSPSALLETLRSRARGKGADTAFVSLEPGLLKSGGPTLRATIFTCGDSTGPERIGSKI